MINFFRIIRQNLLLEGKTRKYFKYAIGEIILVVVGILIALSINNWNSKRLENIELHGFLRNISNNIDNDRIELNDMMKFRDSVKYFSGKILNTGSQKTISAEEFKLVFHENYNIFFDSYLEINHNGFEALKNSGFFGKIQGTKIEKFLNEYYNLVSKTQKQEDSMNEFIEKMEVLAFSDRTIFKLAEVLNNVEKENYFQSNSKEIIDLFNQPSIRGANMRGTMINGLKQNYQSLLKLGEVIQKEIEIFVDN